MDLVRVANQVTYKSSMRIWGVLISRLLQDTRVSLLLIKVLGGVLPGADLFHPYIVLQVLLCKAPFRRR